MTTIPREFGSIGRTQMSKPTPGPWFVDRPRKHFRIHDGTDHRNIAQVSRDYGDEVNEANARLMAAAPEMLAALEAALKDADWGLEDGDEYPPWVEQARAILAKARGE